MRNVNCPVSDDRACKIEDYFDCIELYNSFCWTFSVKIIEQLVLNMDDIGDYYDYEQIKRKRSLFQDPNCDSVGDSCIRFAILIVFNYFEVSILICHLFFFYIQYLCHLPLFCLFEGSILDIG